MSERSENVYEKKGREEQESGVRSRQMEEEGQVISAMVNGEL
jgi:hypothetical protein